MYLDDKASANFDYERMEMMNYQTAELLKGLNNEQSEAVKTTDGPLLIMAGAGSGKTRVLTHRIAYLIGEKGVAPWNILALTFTNKAAREMKDRLVKLVGPNAGQMQVSTFHSMCVRILRKDIDKLGFDKNFTILDAVDATNVVKQLFKERNLNEKQFDYKSIYYEISQAKNEFVNYKEYAAKNSYSPYKKVVGEIYEAYQKQLRRFSCLDFDDLIMKTAELFDLVPECLEYYQHKFQYIHVDEYQDTNHAQYTLVNLLAKRLKNLCVVGDSDQSIYGWRGADISNIMDFEKDYPDAKCILLEQNYRSTKTILDAANHVIKNNANRKPKKLWTDKPGDAKISYFKASDERAEAQFVVSRIKKIMDESTYQVSDFAILYRMNALSRVLEETLRKMNLNYKIYGGLRFYDRKEIKDIIAYLRLLVNPADDVSFERIVNEPKRGIGNTSIDKIRTFANTHEVSMLHALESLEMIGVPKAAYKSLLVFREMIENFVKQAEFLPVTDLVDEILEKSGYREALNVERTPESFSRLENIDEFLVVTKEFDQMKKEESKLIDFLTDLSLDSGSEVEEKANKAHVSMMSLHSAKGLEFPVVFIVGMEENIFPSARAMQESGEEGEEEERRLAYVGITRAEKQLYLSSSERRQMFGRKSNSGDWERPVPQMASRFIKEIPEELIEDISFKTPPNYMQKLSSKRDHTHDTYTGSFREEKPRAVVTPTRPSITTSGGEKIAWSIGDKAAHAKWGIGEIEGIEGAGDSLTLVVRFPGMDSKKLMAKFAPITKHYK